MINSIITNLQQTSWDHTKKSPASSAPCWKITNGAVGVEHFADSATKSSYSPERVGCFILSYQKNRQNTLRNCESGLQPKQTSHKSVSNESESDVN